MASAGASGRGGICLAASPGGHLDLLEAIAARLRLPDATWVTVDGPRARQLRDRHPAGEVIALPWFERRAPLSSLRNVVVSIGSALRRRPRLVVCTGAGGVLAFALACRLLGARLIFVETMARVADASRTARLLGRLADAVVVQWPEGRRFHERPIVCRPLLLADVRADGADERARAGSAAFVGTHSEPFERLLRATDRAAAEGVLPQPVTVQAGVADYASDNLQIDAWLAGDEVARRMAEAEVVIVHGGAGMISSALRAGRRPIVMCRRRGLGEHVDDHQEQLAAKLQEIGLAVVVEESICGEDVERARGALTAPAGFDGLPAVDEVLAELIAGGAR